MTFDEAAQELQLKGYKKPMQYCFTTPEAINILKFEKYE